MSTVITNSHFRDGIYSSLHNANLQSESPWQSQHRRRPAAVLPTSYQSEPANPSPKSPMPSLLSNAGLSGEINYI